MRAETRHQLKQDRFRGTTLQVAEDAATWSAEHKSKIIAGVVAAVVVIAVVAGGCGAASCAGSWATEVVTRATAINKGLSGNL